MLRNQPFEIVILTLFPDFIQSFLSYSLVKRAIEKNSVVFSIVNIRDYSTDKHRKVDDIPFGGGNGMVMTPQPLASAFDALQQQGDLVIFLTPRGAVWSQDLVMFLAQTLDFGHFKEFDQDIIPEIWQKFFPKNSRYRRLVLVCGHYEGMDQRVCDRYGHLEVSIGDYVLMGGETAALVIVETLLRYLPGFLGNENSVSEESFDNGLLEYPQFTRPASFQGMDVPEVLLSGHHENIRKWRERMRVEDTSNRRPDLLVKRDGKDRL